MSELTTIDLRSASQRFSELVRRVEVTGEGYLVVKHGRPVARLLPADERPSRLAPEKKAALARLLSTSLPLGIARFEREDAYAERVDRTGGGNG